MCIKLEKNCFVMFILPFEREKVPIVEQCKRKRNQYSGKILQRKNFTHTHTKQKKITTLKLLSLFWGDRKNHSLNNRRRKQYCFVEWKQDATRFNYHPTMYSISIGCIQLTWGGFLVPVRYIGCYGLAFMFQVHRDIYIFFSLIVFHYATISL